MIKQLRRGQAAGETTSKWSSLNAIVTNAACEA